MVPARTWANLSDGDDELARMTTIAALNSQLWMGHEPR
jgi:hypothetical protein